MDTLRGLIDYCIEKMHKLEEGEIEYRCDKLAMLMQTYPPEIYGGLMDSVCNACFAGKPVTEKEIKEAIDNFEAFEEEFDVDCQEEINALHELSSKVPFTEELF